VFGVPLVGVVGDSGGVVDSGEKGGERMFRHTAKGGRITVYEGTSAFWIVRNSDGEERCMGDGVDMITSEDGCSLMVGTPEFYTALQSIVGGSAEEMEEAYFG
jgi:hypothetical protein